jgi:hypothetical protein
MKYHQCVETDDQWGLDRDQCAVIRERCSVIRVRCGLDGDQCGLNFARCCRVFDGCARKSDKRPEISAPWGLGFESCTAIDELCVANIPQSALNLHQRDLETIQGVQFQPPPFLHRSSAFCVHLTISEFRFWTYVDLRFHSYTRPATLRPFPPRCTLLCAAVVGPGHPGWRYAAGEGL